jgi:hypothetical protein
MTGLRFWPFAGSDAGYCGAFAWSIDFTESLCNFAQTGVIIIWVLFRDVREYYYDFFLPQKFSINTYYYLHFIFARMLIAA